VSSKPNVEALVNPVNCVGIMGKGLALAFKRAYPGVFGEYARACAAGDVVLGRVQIVETKAKRGPKLIVNFPTKNHWRDSSRLEDITSGVADLVKQVRTRRVRSLAVPALGCGLGGLAWTSVRPIIEEAFARLDDDVRVVLFGPKD